MDISPPYTQVIKKLKKGTRSSFIFIADICYIYSSSKDSHSVSPFTQMNQERRTTKKTKRTNESQNATTKWAWAH